jgi:putative ATP-binding cassette transporter
MITPLTIIIHTMPTFARALVAADKVEALGLSLDATPGERVARRASPRTWQRLELVAVTHSYRSDTSPEEFRLGPIDLALEPGELVFVIGGNGSGKTTLAKLLTGLYEPETGVLQLDGLAITPDNRDDYRQLFSAVFSDFRLFTRLIGPSASLENDGRAQLAKLQLAHKVTISNARLSTVELSGGQRKRLALLLAYLEDRAIYVFDEWAADQDPVFREIFYRRILGELRARGKTVVVITHDDRYYDIADRIIKLERGRIEHDERARPRASA